MCSVHTAQVSLLLAGPEKVSEQIPQKKLCPVSVQLFLQNYI
jgi:hypothetical protein